MARINFTFNPEYKASQEEQEWLNKIQEKANEIIEEEIFNLMVYGSSTILQSKLTIKKDDEEV